MAETLDELEVPKFKLKDTSLLNNLNNFQTLHSLVPELNKIETTERSLRLGLDALLQIIFSVIELIQEIEMQKAQPVF